MKKYLIIGLTILLGTNLVVLGGVAYNRMGTPTAQLTLTERELSLPYTRGEYQENSGISLSINWRIPSKEGADYLPYNARTIDISKEELSTLGFDLDNNEDNYWRESKELYWVFEFDGDLHKAEIAKAEAHYQKAVAAFNEQADDTTKRRKKESKASLAREKNSNSRLFFIKASADYDSLAREYAKQSNILIVAGLAKPYYNSSDKSYHLRLQHLSVRNIMIPLEYTDILSTLARPDGRDANPPRYSVTVSWGNRLEPRVVDLVELKG
ncbi:DUF4824 family protein [Litorilituus sediminis]|uniref:DUF4824 family protein n=1 Tax=Litorilituus sediminis TaxID=718192 RepID=A0A4P6P420_9GAMM|nr:DUF4824 family protein [Litorilituus sediminis]QBG36123.1 DUF4824 family protein [Litorilituus sediminis]